MTRNLFQSTIAALVLMTTPYLASAQNQVQPIPPKRAAVQPGTPSSTGANATPNIGISQSALQSLGIQTGSGAPPIFRVPQNQQQPGRPARIDRQPTNQPWNYQQPAYQQPVQRQPTYQQRSSQQSTATTGQKTTSQRPSYKQPLAQAGGSKTYQGNDYDSNAGIGFDTRTEDMVGGSFDSKDGGFVGAKKSVGAGLYGDAGVSQSGKIGNVDIRNHAQAEGFVGSEAGVEAGLSKNGLGVGANAFTGGRVSGTVGTDVGPVGYGATGEAWSGAGLEAGVNAGFDDGVLTFGGELGAALGVGGKLGVQGSIDVGAVGDGVVSVAEDVGEFGKKVGSNVGKGIKDVSQDVGDFGKKVGSNVGNTAKKVGSNVGNTAKKVGSNVGNTAKKAGNSIKGLFKKKKKK